MKVLPRQVLARRLVASLGSEPVTAGPSVDSKQGVLGHVVGSSRSPRLLQKSKATPGSALKASRFWAAGVGDHITRAQKSWESSRTPVDARQCEPAVPPLRLGTQRRPVFPPGRASPPFVVSRFFDGKRSPRSQRRTDLAESGYRTTAKDHVKIKNTRVRTQEHANLVVSPCSNSDWRERRPASANPTANGNDSCSQTGELPTDVVCSRAICIR